MATNLIVLIVYIVCFAVSFFALTAVRFDRFCHLQQPWKIHLFTGDGNRLAECAVYLGLEFL